MGLLTDDRPAVPAEWEARRNLVGAYLIDIDRIRPDPSQPRKTFDSKSINELKESILQLGILQPITVRYVAEDGMFQIITGERRYQAAKVAGIKEMPCWQQSPETNQILVRQVVENWQRVELHPFDLADSLAQLRDQQNYSQAEIAKMTAKPESEISKILSLLKLRPSIQQQYRRDQTGALSRRHLENIAKLPEEQQERFHDQVQEQKLTAKETERIVQDTLRHPAGSPRRGAPAATKKRYVTAKATVLFSFRRKTVTLGDILEVLDAVRDQVKEEGLE